MAGILRYIKNILIAIDQLCNTVLNGEPDETLSSRAHRRRLAGKPFLAECIDAIFCLDPNHCRESYESERLGRQLPPELRRQ